MIQPFLLQVVDDSLALDQAGAEALRILSHWSGQAQPQLQTISLSEALRETTALSRCQVVWLWGPVRDDQQRWNLMTAIQDIHVPTLWLVDRTDSETLSEEDDGMLVRPMTSDPGRVCAALEALCNQTNVIRALRSEVKLLRAHQGGLADQMDKIDEELRLAAQLQREFLPNELPGLHGVEFQVLWRPAGYVSGDVYDVFRLDEDHIGFFLADAVGHGVPAALMTVFIKHSLMTKHINDDARGYRLVEPAEALGRLNRDMITHQNGQVRFATACYGVMNCRTREMRLARAGHPYPMVLRADGATEMIECDGGLLGVFPEEEFDQVTLHLAKGDRLLLYSDGFEVAFPETADDGLSKIANERYATEFLDLRHGKASDALNRFANKLDQQTGSLNQRDDMTILCLAVETAATVEMMAPQTQSQPLSKAG